MNFRNFFDQIPPVTKNLLIINVIVWLAMGLVRPVSGFLEQYGALYYFTSDQFVPSQLITYMFIHANFMHLFFNMFALWMFGMTMERVLGSPEVPVLLYLLRPGCGPGAGRGVRRNDRALRLDVRQSRSGKGPPGPLAGDV